MNTTSLPRDGARFMGRTAILLAMMALALAAYLSLGAKPAQAQTITVDPVTVDFGGVLVNTESDPKTVTIKNTTAGPVTISDIKISGDTDQVFELLTDLNGILGEVLQANEEITLDVSFAPEVLGKRLASLDVTYTDGTLSTQTQTTVLTGTGVTPATADCTIFGTNGKDTLRGTSGRDVICALGGNDTLKGLAGNDVLRGGSGNDKHLGGAGNDKMIAKDRRGKDKLYGGFGKDTLNTKDGRRGDVANGGPQRDKIRKDKLDRGTTR